MALTGAGGEREKQPSGVEAGFVIVKPVTQAVLGCRVGDSSGTVLPWAIITPLGWGFPSGGAERLSNTSEHELPRG